MVFKKAQSTLEYAALIAVATAAILGMQLYFRRGVEGKMKDSADSVGAQYDVKTGGYYSKTKLTGEDGKIQTSASGNYSFTGLTTVTGLSSGLIDGPGRGDVKRFTNNYDMQSVEQTTTDKDADLTFGTLKEK